MLIGKGEAHYRPLLMIPLNRLIRLLNTQTHPSRRRSAGLMGVILGTCADGRFARDLASATVGCYSARDGGDYTGLSEVRSRGQPMAGFVAILRCGSACLADPTCQGFDIRPYLGI